MARSTATLDAARLAIGTLTAVPVKPPSSLAAPVPGLAMALAPAAGLLPGGSGAVVAFAALRLGLHPPVVAILAIAVFALLTRALHLDGLADTADGFTASYDRDRALEVMRRGDSGPAGVVIIVVVLLLQVTAADQVLTTVGTGSPVDDLRACTVLVLAAVASRTAVPVLCRAGVAAARPEGMGATVAGSVHPPTLGVSLLACTGLCALLGLAAGFGWWTGPAAVLGTVVATLVLARRACRRLGGITGDVIGAGVEIGTAVALLVLAVTA